MNADHNNNQFPIGTNSTKMSAIKRNNVMQNEKKAEKVNCCTRYEPRYQRRYRSGSSSDSAITLENNTDSSGNSKGYFKHKESDILDDHKDLIYNFACLMSEKQIPIDSIISKRVLEIAKKYYSIDSSDQSFDEFGFRTGEDSDQSYAEQLISRLLDSIAVKHWTESCESIKCLIRQLGIPNAFRARVWIVFIKSKIGDTYDTKQILNKTLNKDELTKCNNDILNQIDLDIYRTFPNNQMFLEAEGISKLRNVLIGYCIHINPRVGYCQGMNFMAALLLLVFDADQELTLMGLIAIIEHYFPPHYYDQHLTGARADQMLLRELIADLVSNAGIHLNDQMLEEITTALSLNWFLSLFHSSLPFQIRLYVIDCFWLEGVKVLFRLSLALIKMTITFCDIEDLKSSGELINAIREKTKNCYDLIELKRIAFNDIKLPKRKYMATKRSFYVKQITSKFSPTSVDRIECSSQWFRRRSAQLFGFNSHEHKVVISSDRSKVAVLRKTYRSLCEILLLLEDKSESVLQTYWSLKNAVIIGITNNGKRLVFSHCSSKTTSKVKNDIRIDLIGVNFDAFEGFYLEESDSAIIICNSGLVSKCKVTKKQFETIMITNDKNLNIVSAHLNPDCGLVWLDSVSHQRTHTFIAFDANNLDVFTVIQTDFFAIDKFSVNPCDNKSVIVVKSDPINGRLRKVMNILSNSSKVKRISDSLDDVLDINCLTVSSDNRLPENECLIVLVTRNSFDIYVEYRYKSVWKKRIVFLDNTNVSELKTIKIIKVCPTMAECSVTLLVISNDPHIVRLDIRLEQL